MAWVRLRQVALVSDDLDRAVAELREAFGLEVAFRDPAVAAFGLHNAVLPVGQSFIEVVSPTREGTAAGRQMERAGGPCGYMVICHTDDQDAVRARLAPLGVRVAFEADDHGYRILQLHPADTGGSFLEVDYQPGGENPSGPWAPAGPRWQEAVRTHLAEGIEAVTVQSRDPERTARTWAQILGCPLDGAVLRLDNATVNFKRGPLEALTAVRLRTQAPARTICGVRFLG